MKAEIHPEYHPVVYVDGDSEFVTRSTQTSADKREINGVEHYVISVDISSASHPFWTGRQKIMDSAGRIERFNKRYNKK